MYQDNQKAVLPENKKDTLMKNSSLRINKSSFYRFSFFFRNITRSKKNDKNLGQITQCAKRRPFYTDSSRGQSYFLRCNGVEVQFHFAKKKSSRISNISARLHTTKISISNIFCICFQNLHSCGQPQNSVVFLLSSFSNFEKEKNLVISATFQHYYTNISIINIFCIFQAPHICGQPFKHVIFMLSSFSNLASTCQAVIRQSSDSH